MKILLQIIFITILSTFFTGCWDDNNISTKKTTLLNNESGTFKNSATIVPLDENSTVKITRNVESQEMTVLVMSGSVEITE